MLIPSKRHRPDDLEQWAINLRLDAVNAKRTRLRDKTKRALETLQTFAVQPGGCYAGVSWGKDSVVLAHLCATLKAHYGATIPLCWVRVDPVANPDCARVRDAFLDLHPEMPYREIGISCSRDDDGYHATGTLERGFAESALRFGARHISGIRGEESSDRERRMMRWGESSPMTSAPIGWWKASDVFAYLHIHGLPVHPAYAQTQGQLWQRDRIRVASLGGQRGTGHGRREWEWYYYPAEMLALGERR